MEEVFSLNFRNQPLIIKTGKMAKQADGAVFIQHGDTALIVTATVSDKPREDIDFFPLTVDYEERLYAVGRIPGGFIKREGRPTEKAILAARLIDRPLRPLFPKYLRNAVHIVVTVLSVDQDCPPEPLSIIGASAALSISKISFAGPVGAVNVGLIDGVPVVNPNREEIEKSQLYLTIAGTDEAIIMVEGEAQEVQKEQLLEAFVIGQEVINEVVSLQKEITSKVGNEKMDTVFFEPLSEIEDAVREFVTEKISQAIRNSDKQRREEKITEVKDEMLDIFLERYPENEKDILDVFEKILHETLRNMIIQEKIRPDGRTLNEIRPITCEVDLLPRTHGSSLFTRGQTQVLNICTLGALRDVQILDGLGIEETKRFMHHYNFPPYSVGEAGFMRGPGRREIGHGALAEKALEYMIPLEEHFPYTIRLVSEVLESNGSTSMGSVCAGSLSLMDAGVPIKRPVSGIAMGLVKEGNEVFILSDIQGIEDFLGDMDFKVAGTELGITALQMDVKIEGLSKDILEQVLEQAEQGYLYILDKMKEVISEPRAELSPYAPRIIIIKIDPEKIRDVIGPGGKVINKIIAETGVEIDIQPDGKTYIAAVDPIAGEKAREMIEKLVEDVEKGKIYLGRVTRTEKYGAFVEVLPGKEGLIHISHLAPYRVDKTEDIVKVGDTINVKVLDIDDKGRINLSRKEALGNPSDYDKAPRRRASDKRRWLKNKQDMPVKKHKP